MWLGMRCRMKWYYNEILEIMCKTFRTPQVHSKQKNVSSCEDLICHWFQRHKQKCITYEFFWYLQKLENKTWLSYVTLCFWRLVNALHLLYNWSEDKVPHYLFFKRLDDILLWKVVLKVLISNTESSYINCWIKFTCNTVLFSQLCICNIYTHKVAYVCAYIYNILYMNYRLMVR